MTPIGDSNQLLSHPGTPQTIIPLANDPSVPSQLITYQGSQMNYLIHDTLKVIPPTGNPTIVFQSVVSH